jgi:hypothetical protein
METRGM